MADAFSAMTEFRPYRRPTPAAAACEKLQAVADVFRRHAVRTGAQAFRVSSCRIGLIAPHLDEEAAGALTQRICGELSGGPAGSVGVAAWREGESAEQVIERALRAATQPQPAASPPASSGA